MIKYTNNTNLSPLAALWLLRDTYDRVPGTISATTLIKPARATALLRQAEAEGREVKIDLSTMVAARYGTAIHDSLEKVLVELRDNPNPAILAIVRELFGGIPTVQILEQRFFAEINGVRISGKIDAVIDGRINDHKSTSVRSWVKNIQDYIFQLSIYRWLLEKNNIYVPRIAQINFWFTDWSPSKALADKGYPQARCMSKKIVTLSTVDTEEYIIGRLEAIQRAEVQLPECQHDELWPNPTVYAHMREGREPAVRLYDTKEDAEAAICADLEPEYNKKGKKKAKGKPYLQERPGGYRRCKYCYASGLCEQYTKLKEQGLIQE